MYFTVIIYSFLVFILVSFFGKFLGRSGSCILTIFYLFISVLLAGYVGHEVSFMMETCYIDLQKWIESDVLQVSWIFLFDSLSGNLIFLVCLISFLVHLYSLDYMQYDPAIGRFLGYLSLFSFFMLILVSGGNLVQMFLGWEGVGIVSYLLINFWFTRIDANKAALKAVLVNKVGDIGLFLGFILLYYMILSFDYSIIFALLCWLYNSHFVFLFLNVDKWMLVGLFLLVGAIGKSAQLGLHTWLPAAMEGPTPVSALLHAATMVTAGVFLVIRCSAIFSQSDVVLSCIIFIGVSTAFFSSIVAIFQNDIKKIIAFSTCSQLGYMFFACGLLNFNSAVYHLTGHAFYKALLFLSAGFIIHIFNNDQDVRKMGGFLVLIPFIYLIVLVGSLALMGFPFLSGYYTKEAILCFSYAKYNVFPFFAYFVGLFAAGFTSLYSIKIFYLVFGGYPRTFIFNMIWLLRVPFPLLFVFMVLSIFAIFSGFFFKELFYGIGSSFLFNPYSVLVSCFVYIEFEFLSFFIKILPFLLLLLSIFSFFFFFSICYCYNMFYYSKFYFSLYLFFYWMWFIEFFYNIIIKYFLLFCYITCFRDGDKGFWEFIGPRGLRRMFFLLPLIIYIQNDYLDRILYFFLFCFLFCLFMFEWKNECLFVIFLLITNFMLKLPHFKITKYSFRYYDSFLWYVKYLF